MSRGYKQKLKARDKVTHKMSRDGLIKRNAATGEDARVSKREIELDLRGGKPESGTFFHLDKRQGGGQSKKHKQRRPAEYVKNVDKAASPDTPPIQAGFVPEAVKTPDAPSNVRQEQLNERQEQPVIQQERFNETLKQLVSQQRSDVSQEQPIIPQERPNTPKEQPTVKQEQLKTAHDEPFSKQERFSVPQEHPVSQQEQSNAPREQLVLKPELSNVPQEKPILQPEQPNPPQASSSDIPEAAEHETVPREQPVQPAAKPFLSRHIPLNELPHKAKPPPANIVTPPRDKQTAEPQDASLSEIIRHEGNSHFQSTPEEATPTSTPPIPKQRQTQPLSSSAADTRAEPVKVEPLPPPPPNAGNTAARTVNESDIPPPLKHGKGTRLHFGQDKTETAPVKQKQAPVKRHAENPVVDSKPEIPDLPNNKTAYDAEKPLQEQPQTPEPGIIPLPTLLKHDKPGRLHFGPMNEDAPPPIKLKQKPAPTETVQRSDNTATNVAVDTKQSQDAPAASGEALQAQDISGMPPSFDKTGTALKHGKPDSQFHAEPAAPLQTDNPDSPLHSDRTDAPLQSAKGGRLQFGTGEAAPPRNAVTQGRKFIKAQKQADKAAEKLESAKSKLPSKKKLRSARVFDEETVKPKRRLYFENEVKAQGEHIKGAKPLRPVKAAGNAVMMNAHRKMYQVEHENVSVKAAHRAEMMAETGIRSALRFRKTAPYKKAAKLERVSRKKSIQLSYQKALSENPKLKSNIFSRTLQKRKIKKDYAKAAREAQKAAKRAKQAGSAASNAAKAVAGVIRRHPAAAAVIVLILLLLFMLMSLIGAFGSLGSGGLGGILTASYLAEDADIDNAEVAYTEWETDLQAQIANTETVHGGYDEYRYNVGEISHNPYELMAYLTVKYQNFTYAAVEAELRALFAEQYALTFTPSVETRYADPSDADGDGDYKPYDWNVLTVSLTARSFMDVAASRLSGEEAAHYALLLQTKGSRAYVGKPFSFGWLPYVTSYYGYRVHPITGGKDLHRGIDIGTAASTPILSAQDGTVTFAGDSGDYGNVVVIENGDGIVTKYAHCESLLISSGQTVSMGDTIATVGSTGASTGPHLHFEVLKDGQYLNPAYFADTGSFDFTPVYGCAGAPMGDGTYTALLAEAERHLGSPYVWGGSSPSTSFDCSGFISWVLTQSGVKDTGRLTAQGLYSICVPVTPDEARPGDLIFFHSTYSAANPVTHVGLYTGGGMMLHCGDPIQYASIETAYWQDHFYAFGRISAD